MKTWIKNAIKNPTSSYLSYYSKEKGIQVQPLAYNYEKGSLVFTISILFHHQILSLQMHPKVTIFIRSDMGEIRVFGIAEVDESNLDENWIPYRSALVEHYPDFEHLEGSSINFPHLWKRATVKVRPETVVAFDNSEKRFQYDMEILQ